MSNVKFIFVRDHNNFPVGCFAYSEPFDTEPPGMNYGYSIYFFGDKFDRARARQVAQGRLEKDPRAVYNLNGQEELILKMLETTVDTETHQWALRLANGDDDLSLAVLKNGAAYVPRFLGHRFLGACARTAEKLAVVVKRRKEAA